MQVIFFPDVSSMIHREDFHKKGLPILLFLYTFPVSHSYPESSSPGKKSSHSAEAQGEALLCHLWLSGIPPVLYILMISSVLASLSDI